MRTKINGRRALVVGMLPKTWAEAIVANTTFIKKSHMEEMRSAIADVYVACSQSVPSWTPITPNETPIGKALMDQLRNAISNAPKKQ